jgi:hypothetical protein
MYFLAVFSPLISPKFHYIFFTNSPLISSYSSDFLVTVKPRAHVPRNRRKWPIHSRIGPLYCRTRIHESAPTLYLPAPLEVTVWRLGVALSLTAKNELPSHGCRSPSSVLSKTLSSAMFRQEMNQIHPAAVTAFSHLGLRDVVTTQGYPRAHPSDY